MTWTAADEAELRSRLRAAYLQSEKMQADREHHDARCTGKAAFSTREDANRAIKRAKTIHARRQPYRCQDCGKWHIGSDTHGRQDRVRLYGDDGGFERGGYVKTKKRH